MDDGGISLAIGGGAIGAVATLVGSWLKARHDTRRIEPQPLEIKEADAYADRRQNAADHDALLLRMSAVEQKAAATEAKLGQIERGIDRIETKLDKLILHNVRSRGERDED